MNNILLLLLIPMYLFAGTQKISIQFEWIHQFEYAGFYAALEKGYYKDIGLEVELKEFHSGINVSDDVISEKSTFGVSSSSLILEKLQNKPVVLLASYFKQNVLVLLTKPEIKTPHDLKGKTVMALPSEMSRTALGVMLQENQVSQDDYKLIHHDFGVDKFISGEVDAMSAFLTNQPYMLDKKNVKYDILNPANYGIYSYDLELFTSQGTLKSKPDMVKKFVEATNKGWEYAFANKEEIVNLIYNKYSKRKTKDALHFEANKTEKLFKTNIFKIGSVVDELTVLNADIYKKLGLVNENTNTAELLSNYSFERIQSDGSKIPLTGQEREFVKKHPLITLGSSSSFEPFLIQNPDGTVSGHDMELLKLIGKKTGLDFHINFGKWDEVQEKALNKEYEGLSSAGYDKSREKNFIASDPYLKFITLVITKKGNPQKIFSLDDIKGKKVAITKGNILFERIIKESGKNVEIVYVENMKEMLKAVVSNKADFTIMDETIFYLANTMGVNSLIETPFTIGEPFDVMFWFTKDYPELVSIVNKALKSIDTKTRLELRNRWFMSRSVILDLSKEERAYLEQKKQINMCIDNNWMPYDAFKNNQHIGLSSDYFKIFQNNLPIPIKIVKTKDWAESLEFAKQRKCDIFSLAMPTPQRETYMNFTSPYLEVLIVVATKMDVPFISDMSELNGKKLGIPKGYAFAEILKGKYPDIEIAEVKDVRDGLAKVNKGELFGYIGTLSSIGYLFQTEFTGELKIAGKFDEKLGMGVAVRNDDDTLLSIFEKLVNIVSEEEKQNIFNKWVAIQYEKGIDYTIAWQILFVALLIISGTLYWNRKLSIVNKELKKAKAKAEDATKVKANFLANMSHEIRTPMNSIVGMIYMVKQTNLNPTQENYINNIHNSSNNLLKLLNDILDYSKMEAKKLQLNKINFNLTALLDDVNNIIEIDAYDKGLYYKTTYDKSETLCLHGDNLRILQVLINIVSNAVKFTDEGGVELFLEKVSQKRYRFTVKDTGIGIKSKDVGKLFASFTQADSGTNRKYGGTGLGLAISKELVKLMNGNIWVESVFGKGSSFIFEIELESCSEHEASKLLESKKENPILNKEKKQANDKHIDELFEKLKEATLKKRPQLCKPLIEEIELYKLKDEKQAVFENVKKLIQKYKFDEARRLLDE